MFLTSILSEHFSHQQKNIARLQFLSYDDHHHLFFFKKRTRAPFQNSNQKKKKMLFQTSHLFIHPKLLHLHQPYPHFIDYSITHIKPFSYYKKVLFRIPSHEGRVEGYLQFYTFEISSIVVCIQFVWYTDFFYWA